MKLSEMNQSIAQKMNLNFAKLTDMAQLTGQNMPSKPGDFFMLQNKIMDTKNQIALLNAMGLAVNRVKSDAVKQFVQALSGQQVNSVV